MQKEENSDVGSDGGEEKRTREGTGGLGGRAGGRGISGEKERSGGGEVGMEGGPIAELGATSRRQAGHDARPTGPS